MTESYESAWYGTFKLSPDEPYPTPDSDLYPPEIYVSHLFLNGWEFMLVDLTNLKDYL